MPLLRSGRICSAYSEPEPVDDSEIMVCLTTVRGHSDGRSDPPHRKQRTYGSISVRVRTTCDASKGPRTNACRPSTPPPPLPLSILKPFSSTSTSTFPCVRRRRRRRKKGGEGELGFRVWTLVGRVWRGWGAMALEWVVLGYVAGAEAIMLVLLTMPGLDGLRRGLVAAVRRALKPMLSVVPFCLFLLMDIYWKYETRLTCADRDGAGSGVGVGCSPADHLRHQKSVMKSQRNALLIAAALLLYWFLFSVSSLVLRHDQLQHRLDQLKRHDD